MPFLRTKSRPKNVKANAIKMGMFDTSLKKNLKEPAKLHNFSVLIAFLQFYIMSEI